MGTRSAHKGTEAIVSAISAVAVVASDITVFDTTKAIYVGGAGNVAVTMVDGNDATFIAVPVGTVLPIQVTKVKATGTTATNLLALR
jgi:hypothetical protein